METDVFFFKARMRLINTFSGQKKTTHTKTNTAAVPQASFMFDKEQNKAALISARLLKLLMSRLVAPPLRVGWGGVFFLLFME